MQRGIMLQTIAIAATAGAVAAFVTPAAIVFALWLRLALNDWWDGR